MADQDPVDRDVVIPVIQEEVHADAQPVVTGGVRVTKRVETENELIEQQLRTSHADIKRVKTNRLVDGPQTPQRVGNTLVIPVVSEVLQVEKRWVVTEEIHITQHEEVETVQQSVPVNYERAEVERLDETGNAEPADVPVQRAQTPRSLLQREQTPATRAKPMGQTRSLLKDKNPRSGSR